MPKLVSAGRTTTLSTNQVRPTAAESALAALPAYASASGATLCKETVLQPASLPQGSPRTCRKDPPFPRNRGKGAGGKGERCGESDDLMQWC